MPNKEKTIKELEWSLKIGAIAPQDTISNALALLKAQKPKHGRWIPHPRERLWDICSACGIGCKRREWENGGETEYSYLYCPNCGAKMDGDEVPNREKVIKGLECCLASKYPPCDECDYYGDMNYNDSWSCRLSLMADALTLLRLEDASTNDAIPVEWLKKRRDIYLKSYHAGHECDLHTAVILNDLILDWGKEHKE